MTLEESLALAILRGDKVAAYALADLLLEERADGYEKLKAEAALLRQATPQAYDGYTVYQWPEFKKFCERAGVLYDLRTVEISFKVAVGEMLVINHLYTASDKGPQE